MIRIVGAGLILFSTMALGNQVAHKYKMRPKLLRQLEVLLEMTGSEINYAAVPLPELLSKIGRRFPKGAGKIFHRVNEHLKHNGVTPEEAFYKTKQQLQHELSINEEDWQVLENFASYLGKSDSGEQLKQVELCLSHIRANQKIAMEDQRKNERMWRYLGVLAGLMLVILIW
ncbi:stage III sporulation protein AB [Natranaerobius thermophilus]|uniref:Sporulation stage III protein AB n=1 Tax=Natranaerobius thermophilus (strain ATCC BAA-1301 / DSM 18059 / JW/NM-WN-LF) TaxID=457570 RepID=B2A544_NATTJ|nr:stage III sporulation protein AB [Natranaerobius thermophilus]ACB85286.1 sporulation stage III protein AB [Natranaerobius thermophilus JW/NM-WN-LF]